MVGFFGGVVGDCCGYLRLGTGDTAIGPAFTTSREHLQKSVIPGLQRDVNRSLGEQNRRIARLPNCMKFASRPGAARDAQELLRRTLCRCRGGLRQVSAENPHTAA